MKIRNETMKFIKKALAGILTWVFLFTSTLGWALEDKPFSDKLAQPSKFSNVEFNKSRGVRTSPAGSPNRAEKLREPAKDVSALENELKQFMVDAGLDDELKRITSVECEAWDMSEEEHLTNAGENVEPYLDKIYSAKINVSRAGMERRLEIARRLKRLVTPTNELRGRIDLHHHTFFSDGTYSPSWVVYEAWRKGLKAVAVVDHNTIDHFEETVRAGEMFGITAIPAIELDVVANESLNFKAAPKATQTRHKLVNHIVVYFPQNITGGAGGIEDAVSRIRDSKIGTFCEQWTRAFFIANEVYRQWFNKSATNKRHGVYISTYEMMRYYPNLNGRFRATGEKLGIPYASVRALYSDEEYSALSENRYNIENRVAAKFFKNMPGGGRMPMNEAVIEAASLGGVAVVAHPYIDIRNWLKRNDAEATNEDVVRVFQSLLENYPGISGVEVFYGQEDAGLAAAFERDFSNVINDFNASHPANKVFRTIGSDSHGDPDDHFIGMGRDDWLRKAQTPDNIKEALDGIFATFNEENGGFRASALILNNMLQIADYLFEYRWPLKYLAASLAPNVESDRAFKETGIDLSRVQFEDGIISFSYTGIDGKKYVLKIALKNSPQAKTLVGFDLPVSDKYAIKSVPEDGFEYLLSQVKENGFLIDKRTKNYDEHKALLHFRLDPDLMIATQETLKRALPSSIAGKISWNVPETNHVTLFFEEEPDILKKTNTALRDAATGIERFDFTAKGIGIMPTGAIFIPIETPKDVLGRLEGVLARLLYGTKLQGLLNRPYITHATIGYITEPLSDDECKTLFRAIEEMSDRVWGYYLAEKAELADAVFCVDRNKDRIDSSEEYPLSGGVETQRQITVRELKSGTTIAVWEFDPKEYQPHIFVAEELEGKLCPVDRRTNALYWKDGGRKKSMSQKNIRAKVPSIATLKERFFAKEPGAAIVGVTGNENLFYNSPIVTVVGNKVYHATDERIEDRDYPMYVVWPDGHVTIEERVRFKLRQDDQDPEISIDGKPVNVKYATVIQLIKNNKGFVNPDEKNNLAYFYDDVKHLFVLPKFGKADHGIDDLMSDGVFFMADQITSDRDRINWFFSNPDARQQFKLTVALIDKDGKEMPGGWKVPRDLLKQRLLSLGYAGNDFSINEDTIDIRLKENGYPWHIVGVTADGRGKEIAVSCPYGVKGVTLREAAELAEKEGLVMAGIIDQGTTVRLDVDGKSFANPTYDNKYGWPPRASSVIIYAKAMTTEQTLDASLKRIWSDKMRDAEKIGIKITEAQLQEIEQTEQIFDQREYLESGLDAHSRAVSKDKPWKQGEASAVNYPFDNNEAAFNFTKLYEKTRPEHLVREAALGKEKWYIGMNAAPTLKYHMLVVPKIARQQLATADDLSAMQELLTKMRDPNATILHNSLCAGAGVNSLHFHLFFHDFPIFKKGFSFFEGTERFRTRIFEGDNCASAAESYLKRLQVANQPYNIIMRSGNIFIIPRPADIEFPYGAEELAGVVLYGKGRNLEDARKIENILSIEKVKVEGMIGSITALALKAKRQGQKLIIGLETDWIPGINERGGLQQQAIKPLIEEISSLGEKLRLLGIDNVEIIHENSATLAGAMLDRASKTGTRLSNVVVLASNKTIDSSSFSPLRNADEKERPFLAAIDPSEIEKWYRENPGSLKQLDIRIMEMLCLALELASGKEPPNVPFIVLCNKKERSVVFLPKAIPIDFEELKKNYDAQKAALQAA